MLRRIINTTDGKYIGLEFDDKNPMISSDGLVFHPTDIKDLGKGYIQISNSNYIVLAKTINNG